MTKINNLEELNAYMKKNGKNLGRADLGEANLRGADLTNAILVGADLREADLREADLREADLRNANLYGANLRKANLYGADLSWVDLSGANLSWANLREADLGGANLREADLDYSCWTLWCGSLKAQIDDRIAVQFLYHLCSTVLHSPEVGVDIKAVLLSQMVLDIANRFHRANECGKLEPGKGMENRK